MNLVKMLKAGEITSKDAIFFEDMFQPGMESLPYILHQADLMAARIEFEQEWLPKLKGENSVEKQKSQFTLSPNKKTRAKSNALNTVYSPGL